MKKADILVVILIVALFSPFFLSESLYHCYQNVNTSHGMYMSFIKFALLASLGEVLGLRISTGCYYRPGFGLVPRMVVWGLLGMGINMAMIIFSKGVPQFLAYLGMSHAPSVMSGDLCLDKVIVAFAISIIMNTIFAPIFMTLHKITDTHILQCGGTLKSLFTPIPMGKIIRELNWDVQWNFVFKKTIPLFWFPAHTITFLLPTEMRVLFAALLGIVLGVLLAIAARKK